ncbi:unnamed protein product [Protopolystoma xenopodis]|uniref:Uncharacterized protein n=1 Tax=Protopolystoma xenopodis TaxID=117903 RepID=A0A3S5CNV7_9PLAT|nr:unnamed protein product [Protopolystoma xenopodis]
MFGGEGDRSRGGSRSLDYMSVLKAGRNSLDRIDKYMRVKLSHFCRPIMSVHLDVSPLLPERSRTDTMRANLVTSIYSAFKSRGLAEKTCPSLTHSPLNSKVDPFHNRLTSHFGTLN